MKLDMIYYFASAEFVQGYSWDELEAVYINFRNNGREERLKFKEEILHLKKLFQETKHQQIERWLAKEMYATRLDKIELIEEFTDIVLSFIEKYEYYPEIPYEPLKAFKYMLATYITPKNDIIAFNIWEMQQEGDTYIAHLMKDVDYIEIAFKQNDASKIEEILKISSDEGIYVLESQYRDEFIQRLKEEVS